MDELAKIVGFVVISYIALIALLYLAFFSLLLLERKYESSQFLEMQLLIICMIIKTVTLPLTALSKLSLSSD